MEHDAVNERTEAYLARLGVEPLPARTVPFDPGYDAATVVGHIEQSAHLMAMLKLSMATWLIADQSAVQRKIAAARAHGVQIVCGGGPFEVACALDALPEYLDLCAEIGVGRIEAGEGFTELAWTPEALVPLASSRGLEVQFELGRKHSGPFDAAEATELVEKGKRWLGSGAAQLVIEGRESAANVGLFGGDGEMNAQIADVFAESFGLPTVVFEAPTKASQFAMIEHFGPEVWLTNVRLEELLRVEIYRRGLHSDAFMNPALRPSGRRNVRNTT